MFRRCFAIAWAIAAVSCGSADVESESSPEPKALPASAAGTSTAEGPGVPADFAGKLDEPKPLTPMEARAVAASRALSEARNPKGQKPTDRGFGQNPTSAPAPATRPPARGKQP